MVTAYRSDTGECVTFDLEDVDDQLTFRSFQGLVTDLLVQLWEGDTRELDLSEVACLLGYQHWETFIGASRGNLFAWAQSHRDI